MLGFCIQGVGGLGFGDRAGHRVHQRGPGTLYHLKPYSPPEIDRMRYYNIPKAIFYLLKEDLTLNPGRLETLTSRGFQRRVSNPNPELLALGLDWA